MTTSPDLLIALLSLDSYNRGYDAGISDGEPNDLNGLGESGRIGGATILLRDDLGISPAQYQAWQDAGFYAIAYDTPHGTVISYRGTDDPTVGGSGDISTGWIVGAGIYDAPQAKLAFEFYNAVRDQVGEDANIITTGHSLGGGSPKPRLLSDNRVGYVTGELANWLSGEGMDHVCGAPYRPHFYP